MIERGKQDKKVWEEFYGHPERLKKISDAIHQVVINDKLSVFPEVRTE